jgi:hypothetical protein
VRLWIRLLVCLAFPLTVSAAGPVDFGMAELNLAVAARNFKYKPKIAAEINLEAPETFRIEAYAAGGGRVSGGDLRGLMYGLLEAADQIRTLGHLKQTHGIPAATPRGIKVAAEPAASWFQSETFWRGYFMSLARDRFDRLELVLDGLPEKEILPTVRMISQMSVQFGVDLVLGLQSLPADFGPVLEELLARSPAIHSVAALSPTDDVFSRQPLLQVLGRAGRRVVLEQRNWLVDPAPAGSDPERIRAAVTTLSDGFEIPSAHAEDGRPEAQSIGIWGRLGYNPAPEPAPKVSVRPPPARTPAAKARK